MEDSYILANFHSVCRLCLTQSKLMVSIYDDNVRDEESIDLTTKIAQCIEIQVRSTDGMPQKICYRCLFKLNKLSKFKVKCISNELRLRRICKQIYDHSSSSMTNNYNFNEQQGNLQNNGCIIEDKVVMIVDPHLDYESSDENEDVTNANQESMDNENTFEGDMITETYLNNVSMCKYCDQAFVSSEKCQQHEQDCHDPNMPYRCIECSLVFYERSQFAQHAKTVHSSDKPYNCQECTKSFGRRSDLRKHSIVHTGIKPFQCHLCLKSFSRNTNLSKHLRIHANRKPLVCPMCPHSFVAIGDLQRHVSTHSGMKPHKCKMCKLTFSHKDKLIAHELKHLNLKSEHDIEAGTSNQSTSPFPESSVYELPRVPDHISGESSLLQVQAMHSFQSSLNKSHNPFSKVKKLIKNKPKNIKCHQCPKRFSSLDAYKNHVSLTHIGSKIFQCKICFQKFNRKRDLDKHSTLHIDDNRYDEEHNRKDILEKHDESHVVVNMPCIECGSVFERKDELIAHLKSHFSENCGEEKDSKIEIKKEKIEDSYEEMTYNGMDT